MTFDNKSKITSKMIDKLIDYNYTVLAGFDVVDGNLTLNEYFDKVIKHKRRSNKI